MTAARPEFLERHPEVAVKLLEVEALAADAVAKNPQLAVDSLVKRLSLTPEAAKSAVEAGLLLSQTSEISLVIGLAGMLDGDIDRGTFTVITLVTVITMLLTPLLATDRVAWWDHFGRPAAAPLAGVDVTYWWAGPDNPVRQAAR